MGRNENQIKRIKKICNDNSDNKYQLNFVVMLPLNVLQSLISEKFDEDIKCLTTISFDIKSRILC